MAIRVGVRDGFILASLSALTGKRKIYSADSNTSYSNRRVGYMGDIFNRAYGHPRQVVVIYLFRLSLACTLALSCIAIPAPQSFGAINYATGVYDDSSIVFTLFLTEPSLPADGWTFQLFIDSDDLMSTGYGNGIEFVAATDDRIDNEFINVRDTATSDGPGGWGASLAMAKLTLPNDMTVVMEIPLSTNVLPSGFVRFGFELYLDGRIVDAVSDIRTSSTMGGNECNFDSQCTDGLFCTGIETCIDGFCRTTGNPCPGQGCNDALNQCVGCQTDADCDDGLFCNGNETCDVNSNCQPGSPPTCNDDGVLCTTNEYCDATLDVCTGIPNDSLCSNMFACVPLLGCTAIDSELPSVTASGSRFISVELHPHHSVIPVSIFVTSSTWPCLGKYVGAPTAIDFDNNNTLDGAIATLVDNPLDAAQLTPNDWTGKACNNIGPSCLIDSDCGDVGKCLPIRRCDQSLSTCNISADCPAGESCIHAQLHITSFDILPSSLDGTTREAIPVSYSLTVDSAGYTSEPVSVDMQVFGDIDMNAVVNAADLGLVIHAFQGVFHLPVLSPINSTLPAVDQAGASNCSTSLPVIVTANDILMTIKSFQLFSFADLATLSGCPLPCP